MKKTLVILAAGLGSRYKGNKVCEAVGPNGEFLIHYSVYDAIYAGFKKIVFIVKETNIDLFKKAFENKVPEDVELYFVIQDFKYAKQFVNLPEDRTKPLGTLYALYCTKDIIKEKFAVINGDDFYGRESFLKMYNLLSKPDNNFYIVTFPLKNCLSPNGSNNRGICDIEEGYLKQIINVAVSHKGKKYKAINEDTGKKVPVNEDTPISMNLFGFDIRMFDFIEAYLTSFFKKPNLDLETVECGIPHLVEELISEEMVNVEQENTNAIWLGLTFPKDYKIVKYQIKSLIKNNVYPKHLFK